MNFISFYTLLKKEVLRFWKVRLQTIFAPLMSSILYLIIFSTILKNNPHVYPNISTLLFLIPGLIIMSMMQNSFANTSSSIIQSKISGNLIFILVSPISYLEFFLAYIFAAIIRGVLVGMSIFFLVYLFYHPTIYNIFIILYFTVISCAFMSILGMISSIISDSYDKISAFQNFIIMPLTFLSGVFYSIHDLSLFWQNISKVNPLFYMVDGFRYGFFGYSDVNTLTSFAVSLLSFIFCSIIVLLILKSGYKIKQ